MRASTIGPATLRPSSNMPSPSLPTSRSIVLRATGGPGELALTAVPLSPLRPGEVRLRTLAAAINHSDLEIRAGNWPIRREPRFPYVPGLEVVGEIVEIAEGVRSVRLGELAWTAMQGLGGVRAERDGGYAEHVTVAASALALLPAGTDPVGFAALGLAGVTAHEGLRKAGKLAGRTVLVTGPNGGVGSAAVLLARAAGAKVIALGRESPPVEPASVDAVLDVVAGPLFPSLVRSLRPGGTYCLVGAVAGGAVRFDAWDLLAGITLTGYSTEDLDGDTLRHATRALLEAKLPPVAHVVMGLDEAAHAHALLERRALSGRVVLVPRGSGTQLDSR